MESAVKAMILLRTPLFHKALIESDIEAQRAEIMSKLERVRYRRNYQEHHRFWCVHGPGGLDGLLYITDISWGRISHPSEVLKLDQKLRGGARFRRWQNVSALSKH